jgi:methionyl-tRNA synthetase
VQILVLFEVQDEKELGENKCCPVHLKPCVPRKEDNYFFALSKYQHQLEDLLTKNPNFVRPSHRLNEVQGWVKSGLRDFSISRASVEWGIPVPNDTKQTIYVWFDALLGYVSLLLYMIFINVCSCLLVLLGIYYTSRAFISSNSQLSINK